MLQNNQAVTEEITEDIKNTCKQMKMKLKWSNIYETQQKQF